jgi:predicted nucleic acid-binding protein
MIAIDTNILVYAFDTTYPEKRNICKKLIEEIFNGHQKGIMTNQILAEFVVVVTKKIEKPLTKLQTESIIGAILASENWNIINYDGEDVLKALKSKQFFWDALIAQTLKRNSVNALITENEKHFENSGLKIINPFKKVH